MKFAKFYCTYVFTKLMMISHITEQLTTNMSFEVYAAGKLQLIPQNTCDFLAARSLNTDVKIAIYCIEATAGGSALENQSNEVVATSAFPRKRTRKCWLQYP